MNRKYKSRTYKSNGDRFYNPWLSILISLGVGVLIGYLLSLVVSYVE